jgi:hypothetical protein
MQIIETWEELFSSTTVQISDGISIETSKGVP